MVKVIVTAVAPMVAFVLTALAWTLPRLGTPTYMAKTPSLAGRGGMSALGTIVRTNAVIMAALGWMLPRLDAPTPHMANTSHTTPYTEDTPPLVVKPPMAIGAGSWAASDAVAAGSRERCIGPEARKALEPPDA